MRPYKVLHIISTAQPNATSIVRIIAGLTRRIATKFSVHAWFLCEGGPLVAELKSAGARVRVLDWNGTRRDPIGAWRFIRFLRSENFAIIHQHEGGRSVRWIVRWATKSRIIDHLHDRPIASRYVSSVPLLLRPAEAVIATSNAVAEVIKGSRPHIVYPSVDTCGNDWGRLTPSRSDKARVIGTVARLDPMKGILYLIRALALLRTEIPDLRLEIAGTGPEQPMLENEVKLLGLANSVTFLGWQSNIASVLARWDAFALPSLEEGFGIAALEAMAAGLPVVATAVGGIPELVEDGRTGWLVPPGNSAALAERLRELLRNPEQRSAMGTAGCIRARECFSSKRMATAIENIYESLLESKK